MSGKFRGRRAPSPLPAAGYQPQPSTQRFPPRPHDILDADERRDAARLDPKHVPSRRTARPPSGGLRITAGEWKLLIGICVIAVLVRLFRLSRPNSVVFDEVHFGKFAAKYIKTQYYVDVHPPLAKLLITLAAFVGGYDGQFDFKDIGKPFENVPYVMMRLLPATLGVALVPVAYLTLRALDCRATTALLGSLFVTFENGLITQSRHILLDSPLLFFTALSAFFWVAFSNENDKGEPFSEIWWVWLTLTGLALGAVVSCKWVGLFTIATIGFSTIKQLWDLLGDVRVPPKLFVRHFVARAICLIAVPILFYMSMFQIHFMILQSSGEGDGFMSSEFQHTLSGRKMADTLADVGIGSQVTIRHWNTQGGYLHSHAHNYPTGSKQQQITLYPHRDSNNDWIIVNATDGGNGDASFDFTSSPFVPVTPGTRVRFHHIITEKRLHSHEMRPPISEVDFQNEVSGYGFPGFVGDANDDWLVEIDEGDTRDRESSRRLRTLRTKFRLRHALTGCYLFSHKVKLPEWGFEQQEVTCNKNAVRANSLWYIETNLHPALSEKTAEKVNYRKPGFLSKFFELQYVMWTTNAGLTDRHSYDSRPSSWPRLTRGINFWVKDNRQIYLIGNPVVWWLSTFAVLAYAAVRGLLILRAKRGYQDFNHSVVVKYDQLCGFLALGWGLHYFPFFLMQRQLFLHHYFPALYFSILLFCGVFDLATSTLRPRIRFQIAIVLILISIYTFFHFSPLAYGNPWTKTKCQSAQWVKTWDFSCNDFLDDYSQYEGRVAATPIKSASVQTTVDFVRGAPVVVNEPVDEKPPEHATSIVDKVEPGRDIFAGEEPNVESKFSVEAIRPEEEVKQISSVFRTDIAQANHGKEQNVLLPNKNDASVSTEKQAETSISTSLSTSTPPSSSTSPQIAVEDVSSSSLQTTTSITSGSPSEVEQELDEYTTSVAAKPAGPLDHLDAEAERVRQELFPAAD
ncbi:glycosyltransferase family 39 protein [Hysterangium stoloniferum]|nr:glycosyltransferase family 39 protein [Hysterangium stoloniferum]